MQQLGTVPDLLKCLGQRCSGTTAELASKGQRGRRGVFFTKPGSRSSAGVTGINFCGTMLIFSPSCLALPGSPTVVS